MKINYRQLAFILDIDSIDALKKIIFVHCKVNNKNIPKSSQRIKDYIYEGSEWSGEIELCELVTYGGLPTLPMAINQITNCYLTNPTTKKYILCDLPEKELKTKPKDKIKIPTALASLLKEEDVNFIKSEWKKRYGIQC